jgi:hypothetical protein
MAEAGAEGVALIGDRERLAGAGAVPGAPMPVLEGTLVMWASAVVVRVSSRSESRRDRGKEVSSGLQVVCLRPMPPGPVLYVRIPADLMAELAVRAEEFGVTKAVFTTRAIEWYLEQNFQWTTEREHLP